jgi:hypothetical protein
VTINVISYLDLVNKVLVRLRERPVATVNATAYSRLVGEMVNRVKTEVEQAYRWPTLRDSWQVYTTAGVSSYSLDDAGPRVQYLSAYNVTDSAELSLMSNAEADYLMVQVPQPDGHPARYIPNGTNDVGDAKVDIFPVPDASYLLQFNLYAPQGELSDDADTVVAPYRPIIEGAVAYLLAERGEDGGEVSVRQEAVYHRSLADAVAIEAGQNPEEQIWVPV